MIYHNAVKRILSAPEGCDRRAADRYSLLFRALGIAAKSFPIIKIHGESGKSACAVMLSHALTACGYRMGTVTTPFSHAMTECIATDGKPISMDAFADCVSRVCAAVGEIQHRLSTLPALSDEEKESLDDEGQAFYAYQRTAEDFSLCADELLLASALLHFSETDRQIVVVEVPTGTRGNAYRLPTAPLLSIVTATSAPEVAREICEALDRRSGETVSAMQAPAITRMISDRCATVNCRLTFPIRKDFYLTELAANRLGMFYKGVQYTLNCGAYYQALNLLTVLEALSALKRNGFSVDPASASVQPLYGSVGVPLQFTAVSLAPTVLTDFADTPVRRAALAESIRYHKQIASTPIMLLLPLSEENDEGLIAPFAEKGLIVARVIRTDISNPLRTMKPIVKGLDPERTLVITGPRSFVYEIHRALMGLMP